MNDDDLDSAIAALREEHRALDGAIAVLVEAHGDQLEIARLKRRKLVLRDRIQQLRDRNVPDIIA